ncbi:MAG TPA: ABC transporter ATP-binding protein [Vicinamibacterales bacterium]
MKPIIETEGLTKHYGRLVALEDLTIQVEAGEVLGFLGSNGAGKTTTIRLLLDLIRPTRGRARIGGFDCRTESLKARALVGYLPGEMPVYPELTGSEYLDYLASLSGGVADPAIVERLLHRFDVGPADLKRRLRDFSHGMKRKLGIVQALMGRPAVVILDEPTSGLDPLMIEAFCETIDELKRDGRTTVFLSSHVLSEVERTCGRVVLIRRGRLAAVKAMGEIGAAFPRRVTVTFSGPVSRDAPTGPTILLVAKEDRRWVFDVVGELGPLVAVLVGLPIADLEVERFSLEDYVLRLYARP